MFIVSYCEYYYITNITLNINFFILLSERTNYVNNNKEREREEGKGEKGRLAVLYCILNTV